MLVEDCPTSTVLEKDADELAACHPVGAMDSDFDGCGHRSGARDPGAPRLTRRLEFRRCDGRDFLDDRDPSGTIEAGLDEIDAFADGCIDIREESAVTAQTMKERGFDTTMIALTDPATTHMGLGPADRAQLADVVMGMAG